MQVNVQSMEVLLMKYLPIYEMVLEWSRVSVHSWHASPLVRHSTP